MNKRGQVAIWIIAAVAVVVIIGIVFLFTGSPRGGVTIDDGSDNFVDSCIRKETKDFVDVILPNGGFVNPKNSISYRNISVLYLCKNTGFFEPCINQHPALLKEVTEELEVNLGAGIEGCFGELVSNLQSRNNDVSVSDLEFEINLAPQRIFIDIDREIKIGGESSKILEGFDVEVRSSLYDLLNVAIEIGNQEAEFCNFEHVGYTLLYPEFEIEKQALSDGSKVYRIKDLRSEEEMNIAVRSCAIPPGL